METHTINTKSWHYQFINRYKKMGHYERPTDICQYRTWFINAFFRMMTLATLATLLILTPLTFTGAWVAASIMTGYWDPRLLPFPVVLFWIVVIALALMTGIGVACEHYQEWRRERNRDRWVDGKRVVVVKKAGTVKLAYRALKEKFCVKVEFE